ncbi:MAG: response regulator [Bacteroidales bacterium]|nr:response regulator [Bacteroidales bacterium]
MKTNQHHSSAHYLDILNKISYELSFSMPFEKAFNIILQHLILLEEIDAAAFYNLKSDGTLTIDKTINFPESLLKSKHLYTHDSKETELLLKGETILIEYPSPDDFFSIQKHISDAQWSIISPARLNGDVIGCLVFIGKKNIGNSALLLKVIENVSYKIGGVIGRMESDKDISEKQRNLEQLLQSFRDIIVITNKEGKIIYFNSLLPEKTGFLEDELNGLYIYQLFPDELAFDVKKILLEKNISFHTGENFLLYPLLSANKEIIPAETIVSRVLWSGKNMLLWSIRDLKDRKLAEEEIAIARKKAEEANQAKTAFLTNLSFALRIPLSSILGMSELLIKTDLNKNQFNFINIINRSAEQLMLIANQLLDISHIEKGELRLEEKAFSLKDAVIQVLNQQYFKAYNKGIEIICDYVSYGDDIILKGDALRLSQILQNIIDNAIKFTDRGKIEINIQPKQLQNDQQIEIFFSIKDTGKGMNQETLQQILSNCKQKSPISNPSTGDFGLGLIIAYNLISIMGSTLNIESIPEIGTTMSFTLTFKTGSLSDILLQEPQSPFEVNAPTKDHISVLVAEDQPFNQIVIQSMLQEWGFEVDIAENGKQVIDKLSNKHYDVILMDIFMPKMNGIETAQYIRTQMNKPICHIPIIAITANAYTEEHRKFLEAGINDTITKPFKSYLLFSKIIHLLGVSKASFANKHQHVANANDVVSSAEQKFYDLELIKNLAKNQKDSIIKMLNVFIEKSTLELQQLQEYTYLQDWEKVASITHKMKPSFAYLSMKQLESLVQQIHHLAKNNEQLDKIPKLVQNTRSLLTFVIEKLHEEIKNLS